jgi:allantoin racemase
MKILIINPNSDQKMGKAIQESAEDFAASRFEVVCESTPGAPAFIETFEDMSMAAPGMIRLARENETDFDAFVIACHYDPHLDLMKEILDKPVVGIGEASIKIASMLGRRISILTTDVHSIPIHEELVRKYNMHEVLASVRAPEKESENDSEDDKYLSMAKQAIVKDRADVIVLGCAGLTGIEKRLRQKLSIPVLDGVVCALILAAGLAGMDKKE